MKSTSIREQLNRTVAVLVALLVAGVGLTLWVEETRCKAEDRRDELVRATENIRNDLICMSDALRGQLLNPQNELEKTHRRDAEVDLRSSALALESSFREYGALVKLAKELREFVAGHGQFGGFQKQVSDLAEKDPSGATAYYNSTHPSISQQRERLLRELTDEVGRVRSVEERRTQRIFVVGVTGLLVVLAASLLVGRLQSVTIAEPLNRLVATLERMSHGDFTQRLALDRQDEFGILSEGLNRLADDLSGLVGQVQHSGIQVNTTATQVAAKAKEQQSTAHEIATTTAHIRTTSKEISATSNELVRTMNEVNQVAEQTAEVAGSGQAALARMEAIMRQIMDASGSVTGKLAVLSEKTTNINSVVTTITKVADQTNLLSLNAAIEAEKAGEYGLGFAVVAMEIRRLADQTAVATYDIERMVKEMQSAAAAGVMGMDKFSEEVSRGVEEMNRVSTHLAQIINQVQTLTPRFQTVNEGMHAQATGAQQISETLTQLSEAVQQTADSLRQSNLAIEQLNEAARRLQSGVARFKLGTWPATPNPGTEGQAAAAK